MLSISFFLYLHLPALSHAALEKVPASSSLAGSCILLLAGWLEEDCFPGLGVRAFVSIAVAADAGESCKADSVVRSCGYDGG